ncbi:hypothetical protein SAY87_029755 [Trapa incisa]|uniref:Uncharacterized protein n=1 Tax=Trapa incisa TaxID=236973 RepID=A0AAN7KD96_9MYRT|nr:hypothetical protein SAY87_029755 [Trapa incisa]
MFVGGGIFTSMADLYLRSCRLRLLLKAADKVSSVDSDVVSIRSMNYADDDVVVDQIDLGLSKMSQSFGPDHCDNTSARKVLKDKGLKLLTFSFFTTVSTFAGPPREHLVFLLSCLRLILWGLGRWYRQRNSPEIGYLHLLPGFPSRLLVVTVFVFIVAVLFQCINTRHSGETVVALSKLAPAVPVLFVVMMYISIKFLASVVLVYQVAVQAVGVAMVSIYFKLVSRSRKVLKDKGLKLLTFSVFTTVSTFASCGFVPTNENMIVFGRDSFLLLILIPQVLLGNTLFPSCLRLILWGLDRWCTSHGDIPSYLLRNSREIGYLHLLPGLHSRLLVVTVFAFIGFQFALFCAMQWSSSVLSGLSSSYEKIVAVLFQCVNTRHTGETVVDLSQLAPAILVLFVVMMYLPPYTSFLSVKGGVGRRSPEAGRANEPIRIRGEVVENLIFSQLSYLAMFVILVCITERQSMKKDPLNFNVLSIVVEVISAYGNVGFTMGYSCARQLHPDAACTDKWFGFVGKWTDGGKVVLIAVMIFGRLKKFNMNGGRGWKLL